MHNGEMMKVAVCCRQCKRGKTYHLRWYDPSNGKRRNKAVGTDRKRAERQASLLERELCRGTYHDIRRTTWKDFVSEHLERIPGKENRKQAEYSLRIFGQMFNVPPKQVTFDMIELFVEALKAKENTQATINKRLRYLRSAFNKAVKRGYIAQNPMDGWRWDKENRKALRTATAKESEALLKVADELYGFRMRMLIYLALNTGGRRGELLTLTWKRVDLDRHRVLFTDTKDKEDRYVEINDEMVEMLLRLKAQTQQQGGPFIGMHNNLNRKWNRILRKAQVPHITIHDLRRTYITRLIERKTELPTVQKLAGHSSIETTLKYYHSVTDDSKRAAVASLQRPTSVG